ncbi:tRNA-splicing endonuclease subunit [Trebouxia sp. C0010 RCD-2024]
MSGSQSTHLPVPLTVSGGKGYIWDPDGVKWLRQHCRIVGGLTGSTAEQKQHKSAGGLPCKLSAEELALALRQGWVTTVKPPIYPEGPEKSGTAACLPAPAWLTAVLNKQPVQLPVSGRAQCSAGSEATHPPQVGVLADTDADTVGISSNKTAVFSSLHASG